MQKRFVSTISTLALQFIRLNHKYTHLFLNRKSSFVLFLLTKYVCISGWYKINSYKKYKRISCCLWIRHISEWDVLLITTLQHKAYQYKEFNSVIWKIKMTRYLCTYTMCMQPLRSALNFFTAFVTMLLSFLLISESKE